MIKFIIFGGLALITLIVLVIILGYRAILPFIPYLAVLSAVLFLVFDTISITTNSGSIVVLGLGLFHQLLPYDINAFLGLGFIAVVLVVTGFIWYKVQRIHIKLVTRKGFYPANIIVFAILGLTVAHIVRVVYFTEASPANNHNHVIIPIIAGISTFLILSFCKRLERKYWRITR
ncbi:MAG: hypothetical protein FWD97_00550 [Defluviitaleaceae bacterium]|nr:hypothetical protein [Defluviitaleaceae bacterium]